MGTPDVSFKVKNKTGCSVCGEALIYTIDRFFNVKCSLCGGEYTANVVCLNGHYVCDDCHRKDVLDIVESVLTETDIKDPVELLVHIFKLKHLCMHGPEYHSIVPAVLVAAFENSMGQKRPEDIKEAIRRGKDIKGGMCGSHGVCGAAVGAGIACSILKKVTPYSTEERGMANMITSNALFKISKIGGPRCCKRDSMLSVEAFKETFEGFVSKGQVVYLCEQYAFNKECAGERCPYYPAGK